MTLAGVVSLNLLEGVCLGIGLAVILLLRRLAAPRITVERGGDSWHAAIDGTLTFASVPLLTKTLATIPQGADVDLDLTVDFLDHAAFEAIHDWRLAQERSGGIVDIDEKHERWYHSAASGKPQAEKAGLGKVLTSLISRRRGEKTFSLDGHAIKAQPLISGVQEFQRKGASAIRPLLSQLARDGQSPTELFITCSDSRVVPTLFTSSGPGGLFKVRNIGNLVPPCCGGELDHTHNGGDTGEAGMGAAIEYALEILHVESIVVCGHTGCGAMKALLSPNEVPGMPHLKEWLRFGEASLRRFNNRSDFSPDRPVVDQLAEANVLQQLEHLRTYANVREYEADGRVRLVGMLFEIETATVHVYDVDKDCFAAVTGEHGRASHLAELAGIH